MIYKDAAISANVGTGSSSRTTNIHFSTQDIGTAKLTFKVFKDGVPLPLSAVTGKLVLVMADGSKFIKNITIVDKLNGIAEYVLTSEEIKHYGKVQASLNLYYDNKQSLGVTQFAFQIDKDLIDSDIVPIAEYYIEDFETLRQSVEAIVSDLQEKFKDLDNVETKAGAQEKADAVQANLDTHTRNKSNPHGVTKSQIGLGNVDNVQQASKQDFDLHVSDATKHISSSERTKWNSGQTFRITAENGTQKYNLTEGSFYDSLKDVGTVSFYGTNAVTDNPSSSSLRGMQLVGQPGIGMGYAVDVNGNAWWFYYNSNHTKINWFPAETIAGAQSKVDAHANRKDNPHAVTKAQVGLDKVDNVQQASLAEFNAHNYNSIRHISQNERDKWNGGQLAKLTKDDGKRTQLADGADVLTLSSGFYFASGNLVKNNPVENDSSWFNYDVIEGDSGRKSILAWRSYDNTLWHATIHTNGVFKGWKRFITDADFETIVWQNVTLKNGAATGDRPFQYAKCGILLLLRGHITATREVVCGTIPADRLPANGAAVMVPVSGTTGYSKLFINASGDMKLTGIHSNNDSNVTGYYMDAVVALN
ncbi:phage baseplate upper protein [Bacillus inaquosorum]|uniref:Bacteriophage-like protein n=1 Tax=Bacillus inaquosorum KCTC 13429 TaxID=1236548 RepID=A0A9W5PDS7_9BACI|nr:phage baseplate upper protein [Bacillus inaquosorum]AWM17809.1 phage baseplate upper protein [Bacillus inaquosorum]ELS62178.1 bacteriophage-like protein [Bacillus inaquosorum KCTC 13429]